MATAYLPHKLPTTQAPAQVPARVPAPANSHKTLRGLQALRGIAALLVVITHSGFYVSEHLVPHYDYWERGTAGVDLFFVLSGFVMIYASTKLFSKPDGWKVFAERRFLRIVPIYWIATTIKLAALLGGSYYVLHARFNLLNTIESYLFVPTRNVDGDLRPLLGVGWTLNFEIFFYALFAFALRFRANVYVLIAAVLVPLALASMFFHPQNAIAAFYLNTIMLDFLFGMLIAKYVLSGRKVRSELAIAMVAVGFALLLFLPLPVLPFVSTRGLSAALIILGAAALEPKLSWVPDWALFLGDISYVLYLFHPLLAPGVPVILKHFKLISPALSITMSLLVALAVASLIHLFVEKPLTERLKKGLEWMRKSRPLQPAVEVS